MRMTMAMRIAQLVQDGEVVAQVGGETVKGCEAHGGKDNQQGNRQKADGGADHEENALAIEPKQIAVFLQVIGAVQADADAVDAAHGAPDGEQGGEAEQAGARHRENGADFRGRADAPAVRAQHSAER